MSYKSFIYLAFAAVFLVGCSRQRTVTAATTQGASPEPVERAAGVSPEPAEPSGPPPPDPAPVSAPEPSPAYSAPVIPAGTAIRVRIDESLGTKRDRTGEHFSATLAEPIMASGRTILPAGTRFDGRLAESKPSGRLKGRAVLAIRLDGLDWRGRTYRIETSSFALASRGRKRHDIRWIGGGGGAGAAIGGVAGGGAGALIGAGAGAVAGTAGALVRPRKQLYLSAETEVTFRLRAPIRVE